MTSKKEIAIKTKSLAISLLTLIFVIYVMFAMSRAWYDLQNILSADNMTAAAGTYASADFEIYEWDDTNGEWETVPVVRLDFSNAVPNELRRYKVTSEKSFSSVLLSIDSTDSIDDLLDYIYFRPVSDSEDAAAVVNHSIPGGFGEDNVKAAENSFSALLGQSNSFISQIGSGVHTYAFDIYMDKSICNCYKLMGTTGKIKVQ